VCVDLGVCAIENSLDKEECNMCMKICWNYIEKENSNSTKKPALVPLFTPKMQLEVA
jgi:hypothetical protein